MFKADDVVYIAKQPHTHNVFIQGLYGFIEVTINSLAQVITLHKDGQSAGAGAVPFDCLEHVTDPEWVKARDLYHARGEALFMESKRLTLLEQERVTKLAKKYNVTEETVRSIHRDMDAYY